MSSEETSSYVVNLERLPAQFPTHLHSPNFWEALGRVVATFGFLEETLARAIFAITGTREYDSEEEVAEAMMEWAEKLERTLSDQLGALIRTFDREVKEHGKAEFEGFGDLISELTKAATIRNVLCHGSWRPPREDDSSRPFFVNRAGKIFKDHIDLAYFEQVQRSVMELICHVMNTVTAMGWQFPGSEGPGVPILGK